MFDKFKLVLLTIFIVVTGALILLAHFGLAAELLKGVVAVFS